MQHFQRTSELLSECQGCGLLSHSLPDSPIPRGSPPFRMLSCTQLQSWENFEERSLSPPPASPWDPLPPSNLLSHFCHLRLLASCLFFNCGLPPPNHYSYNLPSLQAPEEHCLLFPSPLWTVTTSIMSGLVLGATGITPQYR